MSITIKWWQRDRMQCTDVFEEVKDPGVLEFVLSEIYQPDSNSHCVKIDSYTSFYMTKNDIRVLKALWLMNFEITAMERLIWTLENFESLSLQF